MNSNAPGQLLGFGIQFTRALFHLLQSSPNEQVSVEVLGDVAVRKENNHIISEEDKSSIKSNPLTDRSTDFWKTFFNWAKAVENKELDIKNTRFILYCNQSGRLSIINEFCSANDPLKANLAIEQAKKELKDIDDKHDIWEYYNYLINEKILLLKEIVMRFDLQIGKGAGYDDIKIELRKQHIPETQFDFAINILEGWVSKEIKEKIACKIPAVITWEDFHHQFLVLFNRVRSRELIDYTISYQLGEDIVKQHTLVKPNYLQQLESIRIEEDDIIEAISDYLKAEVNREKWIENEIIDEHIAKEFEDSLKKFWSNQEKRIKLTEKNLNHIEKGQLLLLDCKLRTEVIRDMHPPCSTIPGTYHALADDFFVGWHPHWKKLFSRKE